MPKRLLTLAVACAAVTMSAPPASASHVTAGCRMYVQRYPGTDVWVGVAVGYIIGGDSIRCVVKVDGEVRGGTTASNGVTVGPVGYERTESQAVQLCAQYSTSHGSGETCFTMASPQFPPQEVDDALNSVLEQVDPTICPALALLNGRYGPVEIRPGTGGGGGDVYVNGELWWDCPDYED